MSGSAIRIRRAERSEAVGGGKSGGERLTARVNKSRQKNQSTT